MLGITAKFVVGYVRATNNLDHRRRPAHVFSLSVVFLVYQSVWKTCRGLRRDIGSKHQRKEWCISNRCRVSDDQRLLRYDDRRRRLAGRSMGMY